MFDEAPPGHSAGFPGKNYHFILWPLDPPHKAGVAGHLPVKGEQRLN